MTGQPSPGDGRDKMDEMTQWLEEEVTVGLPLPR